MRRLKTTCIVLLVLLGAAELATCGGPSGVGGPRCRTATLPVTLPADGASYRITGWLCAAGKVRGRTLQLLVHGLSYAHSYWDWPYQPQRYSYVRAASATGYATFAIDRLGVGASDKPPADALTVVSQADVLSQVVRALRAGRVAGTRFHTVIGVGHSGGAGMWAYQAATQTSPDARVDGLILAGFLHQTNPKQIAVINAALYPAAEDPAFARRNLPAGYLTTRPGTRAQLFHNPAFVDPRVVALDEAMKSTNTAPERTSLALARDPALTPKIAVPVLLATGQRDSLGCDEENPALSCVDAAAVLAREAPFYSPGARLQVYVQPSAGHDTNLAPNAPDWFRTALRWADQSIRTS